MLRKAARWLKVINAPRSASAEKEALLMGKMASQQLLSVDHITSLADVEFSVFSQRGEDGIIEWLVQQLPGLPDSFIEFGV